MILIQLDAVGFYFFQQPTAARIVRHQHALAVTNKRRHDMLIGHRILEHRMDMDAAFVGKS